MDGDDLELLRRYADEGSDSAFTELVQRHLNLVYSAALRQVGGDVHRAGEVAQLVFIDLARKAASLRNHAALVGWLYTSTRFAAAKLVRGEQRREIREQIAGAMQDLNLSPLGEVDWSRLQPLLDDAMHQLRARDREALLLRYFEGKSFPEVGRRFGLGENAARMGVERALDRLRAVLARQGVTSTATALGLVLANQAVMAAPVGLGTVVASQALAALAATGAGASLAFMTTTQKVMSGALLVLICGGALYQFRIAREAGAEKIRLERDLADLRSRVSTAERQGEELQKEVRGLQASASAPATTTVAPPVYQSSPPSADEPKQIMLRRLLFGQERIWIVEQNRALFEKLGLSTEQLQKYADLRMERRAAGNLASDSEFTEAAAARGVSPQEYRRRIVPAEFESRVEALLGTEAYGRFQQLTTTQGAVTQLANYLDNWQLPLESTQVSRLAQLLEENYAVMHRNADVVPREVIDQARGMLSEPQLVAWRRLGILLEAQPNMLESLRSADMPRSSPASRIDFTSPVHSP